MQPKASSGAGRSREEVIPVDIIAVYLTKIGSLYQARTMTRP